MTDVSVITLRPPCLFPSLGSNMTTPYKLTPLTDIVFPRCVSSKLSNVKFVYSFLSSCLCKIFLRFVCTKLFSRCVCT